MQRCGIFELVNFWCTKWFTRLVVLYTVKSFNFVGSKFHGFGKKDNFVGTWIRGFCISGNKTRVKINVRWDKSLWLRWTTKSTKFNPPRKLMLLQYCCWELNTNRIMYPFIELCLTHLLGCIYWFYAGCLYVWINVTSFLHVCSHLSSVWFQKISSCQNSSYQA